MIKVVMVFLIVMIGLALFGRFRLSGPKPPRLKGACPRCGRPKLGPGDCPCGHEEN